MTIPHLYTAAEVAAFLRVTPRTIYKWIKEGKLEAWTCGSQFLVPQSAVRKALHRVATSQEETSAEL